MGRSRAVRTALCSDRQMADWRLAQHSTHKHRTGQDRAAQHSKKSTHRPSAGMLRSWRISNRNNSFACATAGAAAAAAAAAQPQPQPQPQPPPRPASIQEASRKHQRQGTTPRQPASPAQPSPAMIEMLQCIRGHLERALAQPGTAQPNTTWHGMAQHSTAQHSTAQHSTAQHSTAQHSTA